MRRPDRKTSLSLWIVLILCLLVGSAEAWAQDPVIFGVVTDESLNPFEGLTLDVLSPGTSTVVAMTTTAADGSYSVTVPAGTYDLLYMPPAGSGFEEILFSGVEVLDDLERNIALVQSEELVTFSGTVKDRDGTPISSGSIDLDNVDNNNSGRTDIDVDGTFSVQVPPGDYTLDIRPNPGSALIPEFFILNSRSFNLESDLVDQNLVIPANVLDITVVDASGNPIPDTVVSSFAWVRFELFPEVDAFGFFIPYLKTDSEGLVRMIVPPLDLESISFDLEIDPPETSGLSPKTIYGFPSITEDSSLTIVLQPIPDFLTADAGADQTLEAVSAAGATAQLDGSDSADPEGDRLIFEWSEGGAVFATGAVVSADFSIGTHTVTLTVTDPGGDSDDDQVTISVVDTTAPETMITSAVDGDGEVVSDGDTTASSSITFNITGEDAVDVASFECSLDGAAYDACASPFSVDGLADGSHIFSARAVDSAGNVDPAPADFYFQVSGITLDIPDGIAGALDGTVIVPVNFTSDGASLAGIGFSVDYDESCLALEDTDQDGDGIPDAVSYLGPAGYQVTVSLDSSDSDGEIDITIFDASPAAPLGDGTLFTLEMMVTCEPAVNAPLTVSVQFSTDPDPSFSDDSGQDVDGASSDGSVTIYGGLRGDCNGSGSVNVADLVASELEIFDGDGDFWADVPGGTFAGQPVGCDANADTTMDAADLSCTNILYFDGTCTAGRVTADETLRLRLGPTEAPVVNGRVTSTIDLRSEGWDVNSAALSLDLDTRRFTFDPTDSDGDGTPDAVRFVGFSPFYVSVRWDPSDEDGELDLLLSELGSGISTATLDDLSLEIDVQFTGSSATSVFQPFAFSDSPAPSFGDTEGRGLIPTLDAPNPGLFADGFESGDLSAWSAATP